MSHTVETVGNSSIVTFLCGHEVVSWAPFNPGLMQGVKHVVNRTLTQNEWIDSTKVDEFAVSEIEKLGLVESKTVLLLTTVKQTFLGHANVTTELGLKIDAYATVGLGNAMAPGDAAGFDEMEPAYNATLGQGTINIIIVLNYPLTIEAKLSLISTVTLAKAASVAELSIASKISGNTCLGTGTDVVVICSPEQNVLLEQKPFRFANMHTRLGEAVAKAVKTSISDSLSKRLSEKV